MARLPFVCTQAILNEKWGWDGCMGVRYSADCLMSADFCMYSPWTSGKYPVLINSSWHRFIRLPVRHFFPTETSAHKGYAVPLEVTRKRAQLNHRCHWSSMGKVSRDVKQNFQRSPKIQFPEVKWNKARWHWVKINEKQRHSVKSIYKSVMFWCYAQITKRITEFTRERIPGLLVVFKT